MFKKNFIKLCNEKGEAPTVVCMNIGLSKASFSKWDEATIPRETTLLKIADYFGTTVEYLLSDGISPEEPPQELYNLDRKNIYMVPIYENVSAGFGACAIDYVIDYIPLFIENSYEAKETICIKVKGDSMYPKIEDGDIIQVHKQDSVDNGSIAVVLLDGDIGLVKKVYFGDDWIELHSINPEYNIKRFNKKEALRVRIVGLVRTIIKRV